MTESRVPQRLTGKITRLLVPLLSLMKALVHRSAASLLLFPLLVTAVAIAAFASTYRAGFTWDDEWLILENPRIADPTYIKYMLFERELWRPIKRISLMLDYWLYGPHHPEGFHATNIALHAGVCLALYFFLLRLSGERRLSLVTSLLFALHPVHVESIANISHRKEPMALLFVCLAFLSYLAARSKDRPRGPVSRVLGHLGALSQGSAIQLSRVECVCWAVVCYLLAMLSKEAAAMMFPATVVVYELVSSRDRGRRLVPAVILGGILLLGLGVLPWSRYVTALAEHFGPEQVSWVTPDREQATEKSKAMVAAAVRRVGHHQPLHVKQMPSG